MVKHMGWETGLRLFTCSRFYHHAWPAGGGSYHTYPAVGGSLPFVRTTTTVIS